MKKILLLVFVLLSFTIPCFAASWYWVGSATNGAQYYIDNSSVNKNYQYAVVWMKIVETDGTYSLQQIVMDHYNKSSALRSYVNYDSDGVVTYSNTVDYLSYSPIAPGSMSEAVYYSIWGS